jgi:hypothetical protein
MAVRLSALNVGRPLPISKIHGNYFCWRLSRPQGHSATGTIMLIEKSIDIIWNRTLPVRLGIIVPQPCIYCVDPVVAQRRLLSLGHRDRLGNAVHFSLYRECTKFVRETPPLDVSYYRNSVTERIIEQITKIYAILDS